MRPPFAPLIAVTALASAAPLAARSVDLAIPAGTVSESAIAIARATGASIVIADPATGRIAELGGFGETNRATFLSLLQPRETQ